MAAEKPANNIATKTVSIKGETYFGGQRFGRGLRLPIFKIADYLLADALGDSLGLADSLALGSVDFSDFSEGLADSLAAGALELEVLAAGADSEGLADSVEEGVVVVVESQDTKAPPKTRLAATIDAFQFKFI
jgi:hypothetical protein